MSKQLDELDYRIKWLEKELDRKNKLLDDQTKKNARLITKLNRLEKDFKVLQDILKNEGTAVSCGMRDDNALSLINEK